MIMPERKENLLAHCFNAALLFFLLALAGCASADYKPNLASGLPKPTDYPIPVYTPEMKVPRPTERIGSVFIRAGDFTIFGGSAETELAEVMQEAHQKGADAVKIVAIDKPDFANPNYRITADLLRYSSRWETVAISGEKFQAYLDANRKNLDPIEGVWFSGGIDGLTPHTIGIIKDKSKTGRDFVGFMLNSENPAWPAGMKKMDIRRGLQPGSYILTYYMDDFAPREVPIILGGKSSFTFNLPKDEEDRFITYRKN